MPIAEVRPVAFRITFGAVTVCVDFGAFAKRLGNFVAGQNPADKVAWAAIVDGWSQAQINNAVRALFKGLVTFGDSEDA